MEETHYRAKRMRSFGKRRVAALAAVLVLLLGIAAAGARYFDFVSQTVYEESTAHLAEVLHQSNNMLNEVVEKNLTYYSGHHRKSTDGSHRIDYFPLPVITVDGFCDVVIDLDCVTVNSKLRRENALSFAYEQLGAYEFEICGEDDDTIYHHHPHVDTTPFREAVLKSSEKDFKFSFRFNFDIDGDTMYEFVKLLRRKGFFY